MTGSNLFRSLLNYRLQHPGGIEVLLDYAGMEATYAFEDVGHSLDARDLLAQYYIGDLHEVSILYYKSLYFLW